jgi:septum formation protein
MGIMLCMKITVVLASSSFLKNYIMKRSHIPYVAADPDIDESQLDHLPVDERVQQLAKMKAQKVVADYSDAFVIATDTLTQDDSTRTIYGKPSDPQKQYEQALSMSGKSTTNITGISIFYKGKELETCLTKTKLQYQLFDKVTYDRLTRDDNPQRRSSVLGMFTDAAGFTLLEEIHGSYTGAMGLPMEVVYRNLRKVMQQFPVRL